MAVPGKPTERPAKKPARPPDQVVRDIRAERATLIAAFDAIADELSKAVAKAFSSKPAVTATGAARTGARWSSALRRRRTSPPPPDA